ncbi:hypothetical protein E3Q10_00900 [Wallemia mellicola]|uniref:NAD(P)-binding protein n=1 Tax=Wallemia mellicola TaxID=1708541 RepID=A0A4T0R039_9BASI|nr:hypothetical protein E3Q11_00743 [Wallemia mellicola]TIC32905.1 hypothetical protein E3Q10_00900 [Wallemia mellicola]
MAYNNNNATVLLVGSTGFVGGRILNELIQAKHNNKIGKVIAGVNHATHLANVDQTIQLDYHDDENLNQQLKGVDVVISAISITPDSLTNVDKLLTAMAFNKVKLYIPSEYGVDYNKTQYKSHPVFVAKSRHIEKAKQFDFKTVSIYSGLIMEFTFGKLLDMKELEWKLVSSKQKVALTSLNDLSSVIAQLAATPLEDVNKLKSELRVFSDCRSIHKYARVFEDQIHQPIVLIDVNRAIYEKTFALLEKGEYTGDQFEAFKATVHLIASEGSVDFTADNDNDTETLNRIAATEAHFMASQKPRVSNLNTPPAVPSPEEGPPRKLTRRTGPSVTHSIAKDMQSVDNSDRSFGASAQAKSTPVQHIPPSSSPATTFARDNSAILAAELSRMRRQKDEEIEKRMQTSNQLKAQYEINYRAHGEIETDQEELKAQKEKLRAEVARLQALNADLNTKNETSNEKMEIDMMFQRHEAETSIRKQNRSTVSPQRRTSRASSMGFPGLQNSFARNTAGLSRGKTAMPAPPIASRKDEMDWQSETNERRAHSQPRPTTSKNDSSDWEKFTHLLFNHLCCYPSTRAYRQLTIQLILNADVESVELDKYNRASVELLETFGEEVVEGRTDAAFAKVVKNLNIFVEVFLNCGMLTHLAETLALLASLVYANEKILDSLLSPVHEVDGSSLVLSIMKIVKKHLKPKTQVNESEEMKGSQEILEEMIQDNLMDCVLNFVETVVMHSQDSQTGKLMPLLKDAAVIQIPLLSSQKPCWREYLAQLGDLDVDIYYEFLDFPNKLTSISEFDDFYASLELLIQPSQDGFYDSQQIDPFSNLELFEAFLDYVNNKSPSIPKLSSNSNNNDDDHDEILQNKVKTFDNFLTSNNLGDIHKGNENLRKFFDYRSTNFNDVVGIGSHQHALLSLASFYYSNNLIEESSRLLNEAIIISRISKDLETLEKSIKLRRLLGNKKTCVDIYKSSTEDLTIMDELNDIKLSLNQVGVIVLLMAALSDYFKGDKLSDLFIRSTRALIRLEENTVQDKVDASLQTWSTINAILWDMAGVKSIRDIYQDLSLKGETWHTSAQLTCRINIAHQYSQNGEYASALDCLFNQKLLSEINLSDYTIWANAIWSVLKQRSDRLDRQWTGPDVESSNDQEMVNKIESLIGNAVENDGNRDLTLEQLLLSYKMADDRQYLKLKLKAQLELAGFETRYNYGITKLKLELV